jgi:hypothetical protein
MVHPKAHRASSEEDAAMPAAPGPEAAGPEAAIRPSAGPGFLRSLRKPGVIDACLAVVGGLCVLLVHDVPYILRQSFWVDEAWVADTVRAPIGLTHSLGLITPLGWTFLLRLVPFGGPERLRLVPLAFTMLAAATGYLFGRELRLSRFTTGILTGAAVLLSPAMLLQNDLKEYTAEAFACLVMFTLVAHIENEWRIRRLAALAAVASVGLLFANTLLFLGVAAMASLGIECLVTRHYRRLIELAAASAGMLVVSLVIYEIVLHPEIHPNVVSYWDAFYVPTRSVSGAAAFVHQALHNLAPYMGFRSLLLDTVGAVAGVVALVWLRRYALAVMFPVLVAIVIVASAAREYPFGDPRTSTFWLVLVPLLMAVAVAAVGKLATTVDRRMPALVAVVALAVWVPVTRPDIRAHSIPVEDVHSEVTYLEAHYRPGDVVIVSYGASFGFAYYYSAQPSFPAGPGPNDHVVAYPQLPWMVVLTMRQAVNISNALATARAKIAAEPADARGRIWIIRSHQTPVEVQAWNQDLAGDPVRSIPVGHDPILLYSYVPPGSS